MTITQAEQKVRELGRRLQVPKHPPEKEALTEWSKTVDELLLLIQKADASDKAQKDIQSVTDGALYNSDLNECVKILISQRDNARIMYKRAEKRAIENEQKAVLFDLLEKDNNLSEALYNFDANNRSLITTCTAINQA